MKKWITLGFLSLGFLTSGFLTSGFSTSGLLTLALLAAALLTSTTFVKYNAYIFECFSFRPVGQYTSDKNYKSLSATTKWRTVLVNVNPAEVKFYIQPEAHYQMVIFIYVAINPTCL